MVIGSAILAHKIVAHIWLRIGMTDRDREFIGDNIFVKQE